MAQTNPKDDAAAEEVEANERGSHRSSRTGKPLREREEDTEGGDDCECGNGDT
jgi:hypothetical protein